MQPSTWPTPWRRSREPKRFTISPLTATGNISTPITTEPSPAKKFRTSLTRLLPRESRKREPWPLSWAALRLTAPSNRVSTTNVFNENPDDPAAEQRRFNFFDYAADGQLNGSVTINQFKMLGRILLPSPDAYDITDRQRASANGFLLNPTAKRDFVALQRTLPQYQWVPPSAIKKYRNVSPAQFGVSKGIPPGHDLPALHAVQSGHQF